MEPESDRKLVWSGVKRVRIRDADGEKDAEVSVKRRRDYILRDDGNRHDDIILCDRRPMHAVELVRHEIDESNRRHEDLSVRHHVERVQ